jgi:hypothetical protein
MVPSTTTLGGGGFTVHPTFRRAAILGLGFALLIGWPALAARPIQAGPPDPDLSATLDGVPIPLEAVGALACHDLQYPVIRCFSSVDDLMAVLGAPGTGGVGVTAGVSALAGGGYVIAFDQFQYGGSNPKVLSSDQSWLFLIGWNDVTSSFKSYGATGRWWEHSPSGGLRYSYGPSTQVPALSSTFNNKFSAFVID